MFGAGRPGPGPCDDLLVPHRRPGTRAILGTNTTGRPLAHDEPTTSAAAWSASPRPAPDTAPTWERPEDTRTDPGEQFALLAGGMLELDPPAGAQVGGAVLVAADGAMSTGPSDTLSDDRLGVIIEILTVNPETAPRQRARVLSDARPSAA